MPLTDRIEGEVWISILVSVIGHWLLSGLTILITTHNTNQTHVEFCPTNPRDFYRFFSISNMNLAVLDLSHPSQNMTNAENHSVNFPLVAFNDPYDQYYIISRARGGVTPP